MMEDVEHKSHLFISIENDGLQQKITRSIFCIVLNRGNSFSFIGCFKLENLSQGNRNENKKIIFA